MSAGKSALFVALLFCLLKHVDSQDVTVKSGEDATLECYGPRDATVGILKWRKPDLKSESYVFLFRENSIIEKYQDPSFKDRVKLRDPEMKKGDFSVIVKSVTTNDSGIYECYAGYNNQEPNLINRTSLKFEGLGQQGEQGGDGTEGDGKQEDGTEGDGDKAGSVGLKAGVLVAVPVLGVIAAVVGSVIYRRCRNQQNQDNII